MGDDDEEQFRVEDILAFTEKDIGQYAPTVRRYFSAAMKIRG